MKKNKSKYTKEFLLELYRKIYTTRIFEHTCIPYFKQGVIRGYFHPYLGEEAIAVGVCAALREQDYIISTHRGHGHCIARGADVKKMAAELFGKETGYCKGRGGSMHIADFDKGNLGANGIVGASIPIGVGAALGASIRGEDRVTVVFSSDGGVNNGVFSEALNLAGIWNVPMILVVENNQYAVSTPVEDSTRETQLYKRGESMGIPSYRLDGNDVLEMYEHTKDAVERCSRGEGPVYFEAMTYRHGGHHCRDEGKYMPQEKVDFYAKHDPLLIAQKYLTGLAGITKKEIRAVEKEIDQEMLDAIQYAEESPKPSVEIFLQEIMS